MQSHIRLGRIFGVEIGLHLSWLIIAFLITLSLAGHFHAVSSEWGAGVIWTASVATAILFFASIVVHELSHALVARARKLPVQSITLFALGGVAQIKKEAVDASTEFWMGIVGPITSAAIGALCLGLALASGWSWMDDPHSVPLAMLVWLGYINLLLAAFNMLPGFPLDGGRVLRAILWWYSQDRDRATRQAAWVGQALAFAFIGLGLLQFFGGAGLGGLWIAFIGWFLLEAARASYAHVVTSEILSHVSIRDVMSADCPIVSSGTDLQSFAHDHVMRTGRRCFVVAEDTRVLGLLTPHEVKEVPRDRWPDVTVGDVMRPLESLHTVLPDATVTSALERMTEDDVNQLPVVSDGRLLGIISRGHVLRYLKTRAELQM
jgi:Zn-dependent protease/predicted transcriptional regulator